MAAREHDDWLHVVAGIVMDRSGRVLTTRRKANAHCGGCWEFPGGKVECSESALTALQRELHEEIGIEVVGGRRLIQIRHAYPERQVFLDVWKTVWRGRAVPKEGQGMRWVRVAALEPALFPPANLPILKALKLPPVYLISPEPVEIDRFIKRLETCFAAGIRLFQLRAKSLPKSALGELAARTARLCEAYGAVFLINGRSEEAPAFGAHGVHLSSSRLMQLSSRPLSRASLVAASCHNAVELVHAGRLGLDFAVLSPVLRTASHPGAAPLGWSKFAAMTRDAILPVFALGGLDADDLTDAWAHGAQGISVLSAVWQAPDPERVIRDCLSLE